MTFPTPYTLTRKPYTGYTTDSLGNELPGFGPGTAVPVTAISPHQAEEGSATRTETQVADLDVYMPKTTVSLKDQFVVDGEVFEVVGVLDWTRGFHGWPAGIVVELRRVT